MQVNSRNGYLLAYLYVKRARYTYIKYAQGNVIGLDNNYGMKSRYDTTHEELLQSASAVFALNLYNLMTGKTRSAYVCFESLSTPGFL